MPTHRLQASQTLGLAHLKRCPNLPSPPLPGTRRYAVRRAFSDFPRQSLASFFLWRCGGAPWEAGLLASGLDTVGIELAGYSAGGVEALCFPVPLLCAALRHRPALHGGRGAMTAAGLTRTHSGEENEKRVLHLLCERVQVRSHDSCEAELVERAWDCYLTLLGRHC